MCAQQIQHTYMVLTVELLRKMHGTEMSSGRNMGAWYKSVCDYYVILTYYYAITPTEGLIQGENSSVRFLLEIVWLQPQCVKNLSQDNNILPPS